MKTLLAGVIALALAASLAACVTTTRTTCVNDDCSSTHVVLP